MSTTISASNPWSAAYLEGGGTFEKAFLNYLVGFVALNQIGHLLGRRFGPPLSTRPTVLAGTAHAAATSAIAIFTVVFGRGGTEFVPWQRVALPLSLAYFVADLYWYCLLRRDVLIAFHHLVMCLCHYPVGHGAGAALAGAGDPDWVLWLSAVGYTSEVSTVLMNYRWYLLKTLEEDWIGFAVVNVLVLLSWAARVVLFAYLLAFEIGPRALLYVEEGQVLTYAIMVAGHGVIGVLSLYWLRVMCRGGIRSLITFQKKSKTNTSGEAFAFGADIGRGGTPRDDEKLECPRSPVVKKARAWVDGTFFNDPGVKSGGKCGKKE